MNSHTFACITCPDQPSFGRSEFLAHLMAVHGCNDRPQGKRTPATHSDGKGWFSSTYDWEFDFDSGFVKAVETIEVSRASHDTMGYEADAGG